MKDSRERNKGVKIKGGFSYSVVQRKESLILSGQYKNGFLATFKLTNPFKYESIAPKN